MNKNKTLELDNELKNLSIGVYVGNEKYVPKDWIKINEYDNKKTGFHGEAFYKNGKIAISFRGTENSFQDIINDAQMGFNQLPNQYVDAQNFYEKVKKDFPYQKIIFTGHSLGGSLAQLMSNETGNEAVTFNAYGIGDLVKGHVRENLNIRNYGNVDDTVFNLNLRNQLGKSYIIGYGKGNDYVTKSNKGDYIPGLHPRKVHNIENMGKLEDAVEYKKPEELQPKMISGKISYDIDYRDIDKNRVMTNEEIGEMSKEEFKRNENFIDQLLRLGRIITKKQAEEQVKSGDLIYVNSYTRDDGTEVSGYYRRK